MMKLPRELGIFPKDTERGWDQEKRRDLAISPLPPHFQLPLPPPVTGAKVVKVCPEV